MFALISYLKSSAGAPCTSNLGVTLFSCSSPAQMSLSSLENQPLVRTSLFLAESASPKSGQISIQIFRYTVLPPEIVIGVQESLMLLVNSHILKMAAMLKPSAEYNRRAAIIKDLRAGRSAMEIIRFFGYPRSTVYDVVAKYTDLEQFNEGSSMPARKSHSKERTARIPAVVERAQTLISDDPRQSLRKLASIVGVSEPTMRRIAEEDLRYKSYTLKRLSEAATTRNCSICPDFGDAPCI
ncbi:hypothetical protein G5I_13554 [Acromyrmex echinatior]|uniref:Helix-turn-helix domain-containing protein n=1 Tax=Acromyrmex echinatior TaxID=103372 RepID=F4X5C5_ACREC|nr:hypothetical protein G5I_13554 [Acromyrmex echinatior]